MNKIKHVQSYIHPSLLLATQRQVTDRNLIQSYSVKCNCVGNYFDRNYRIRLDKILKYKYRFRDRTFSTIHIQLLNNQNMAQRSIM